MNKTNRGVRINNTTMATLLLSMTYYRSTLTDFYNTFNQNKTAYTIVKCCSLFNLINHCVAR